MMALDLPATRGPLCGRTLTVRSSPGVGIVSVLRF